MSTEARKTYTFAGKQFTLRPSTYGLDRKVKLAAGIEDESIEQIKSMSDKVKALKARQESAVTDEDREKLAQEFSDLNISIAEAKNTLAWHEDYVRAKSVLSLLLDGDVESLTEDDFGKDDSLGVWQDYFFSAPAISSN